MEVIVREVENKLLRLTFSPTAHQWFVQNPPSEYSFANLGTVACFVKRQNKRFSGWGLLIKAISEEQIRNTPRVVSLAQDNAHYYFFTELLDGSTLDGFLKTSRLSKLNLRKLVDSVFVALRDINSRGYWYADLCKKNIFALGSGDFNLIDLDSCIPSSTPFFYDLKVAVEYPSLLKEFAREVQNNRNFQIFGLPGECVNQAEIVGMAIDSRKLAEGHKIPMDKKTAVIHGCLMREARREYSDLFSDLTEARSNWLKARKLIDKLLR